MGKCWTIPRDLAPGRASLPRSSAPKRESTHNTPVIDDVGHQNLGKPAQQRSANGDWAPVYLDPV
ncbi:hypothetical protein GCM10009582_27170 [Arthrobacter flavus]